MNADVCIRHCTLRIVRRGGWSWGANPRALLGAATRSLPQLIGARFAELWPAALDCELAAPVRLRVPVNMEELLALADAQAHDGAGPATLPPGLARYVDALARDLLRRAGGAEGAPAAAPPPAPTEPAARLPADLHAGRHAGVLAALLDWHRRGMLQAQLLQFSAAALASWHARLSCTTGAPDRAGVPCDAAAVAQLAARVAAMPLPLPHGAVASLLRRISLMAAAAGELGLQPADPLLAQAFAAFRAYDLPADEPSEASHDAPPGARRGTGGTGRDAPARAAHAGATAAAGERLPAQFEVNVESALPFLLLGPLSRTGYLQTLGAVFDAAGLLHELPCFAVALARKVLEPPLRGWFRSPEAVCAAAAFAGHPAPPEDARIAALARRLAPLVSPLDALVASVLTAGHAAGNALLLQSAPLDGQPGWLLCDAQGLFPVARTARLERLYPRLAALGGDLLLVPQNAVDGDLLDRLHDAGFRFVTDASPARRQDWRALSSGALRAWTNDRAGARPQLAAAAARIDSLGPDSAALWRGLAAERPGLPAASAPEVEASLALAAALALGTLAWDMWRDREPVTPLLALQRFGDLGALVRVRPDCVQVHLPLGRRFLDLKAGGWLADVPDVPWLGGRPLLFAQG